MKQYQISWWLLQNGNRKPWVTDRTIAFLMTFSDPHARYQGYGIRTGRTCETGVFLRTYSPRNIDSNNTWPSKCYHFHWPWWPVTPICRSRHFVTLIVSETTTESHRYCRKSIGSHTCVANGDISNDLAGTLARFAMSHHFGSQLSQQRCFFHRQSCWGTLMGTYAYSTQWYHLQ